MSLEDFVKVWNESIEDFKLTSGILQNIRTEMLLTAFEALISYMGYDLECITEHNGNGDKEPLYNLFRFISHTHQNISSIKITINIYDIYSPAAKRTIRILRELHNYALYDKLVSDELQKHYDEKNEMKVNLTYEITELINKENSLAVELGNLESKISKSNSKFPRSRVEGEQWCLERDTIEQNVQRTRVTMKDHSKQLECVMNELNKLDENNEMLRAQLVKDPSALQDLETMKLQKRICNEDKRALEVAHRNKTDMFNKSNAVYELWEKVLNELKLDLQLSEKCQKVQEKYDKRDQYNIHNLENEYANLKCELQSKKIHTEDIDAQINEHLSMKIAVYGELQRKEQSLHEQVILLHREAFEAEEFLRFVDQAIEKNATIEKDLIEEIVECDRLLQTQIESLNSIINTHCAKFKSVDYEDRS